ncbi:helix-turn-helix transcriptional regulator [Streptomyces sp. NPDC051776]|uniref:helix-turn-helix domain-containing protein n=1 Tax=Streptomyces sp. NPDC051776 TaxID=3155414 RepID=UPI003428DB8E
MPPEEPHQITCHLDRLLGERGMTLAELAEGVGVTVANLSILKNDRAKAIRFSTLSAICRELECQPGELLTFAHREAAADSPA